MTVRGTIDLVSAAGRKWDALVIGAGPAGTVAARELARHGVRVLLVDRAEFPRRKVCGGCLNPHALSILETVGLREVAERCGIPLRRMVLSTEGARAELELPEGRAICRATFDAVLVEVAIAAGVDFLPGVIAELQPATDDLRPVRLRTSTESHSVAAPVVLAASGLGGTLFTHAPEFTHHVSPASRVGAGTCLPAADGPYPEGTIHMAVAPGGYVGITRTLAGELTVAAAFDVPVLRRAGSPALAAEQCLERAGLPPIAGLSAATWRGTPPLTCHTTPLAAGRVLLLGDAAGYVEPFSGEGMAWAIAAATAVTPAALEMLAGREQQAARVWEGVHQRVVKRRQRICRLIRELAAHPALSRLTIRTLHHLPFLATPLVKRVNAPAYGLLH